MTVRQLIDELMFLPDDMEVRTDEEHEIDSLQEDGIVYINTSGVL